MYFEERMDIYYTKQLTNHSILISGIYQKDTRQDTDLAQWFGTEINTYTTEFTIMLNAESDYSTASQITQNMLDNGFNSSEGGLFYYSQDQILFNESSNSYENTQGLIYSYNQEIQWNLAMSFWSTF